MTRTDIYEYDKKEKYPSTKNATIGILVVLGVFFGWGAYSLLRLWETYGPIFMSFIQGIGLPTLITQNVTSILVAIGAYIAFNILLALAAAWLAKTLGGKLIIIGAVMISVVAGAIILLPVMGGTMTIQQALTSAWIVGPMLLPVILVGLFYLLFRGRMRVADQIIRQVGKICLEKKGIFIPPLVSMVFTLLSAVMMGAIVFQFTPIQVLLGTEPLTVENGWPLAVGLVLYIFLTTFFFNLAYGTSSAMAYLYMRGRDASLGNGLRSSLGVIGALAVLSIFSVIIAIIRMIIRAVARKAGGVGRVAGNIADVGIAYLWMLINYFTIPVMIVERKSATQSIKRSAIMVKDNLVDVLIKETGVRLAFKVLAMILFIGFALAGGALGWIMTQDLFMTILVLIGFMILAAIPITLTLRTFDIIYVTLLYIYIRKETGEIKGKIAIPSSVMKKIDSVKP